MNNKKSALKGFLLLFIGELAVSAATVAVFALLGAYTYKVISGALLGSAVAVLNFAVLSFTVNRAIDRFMELRGSKEMTDEEADAFTAKHAGEVQSATKLSFLVRTFSMLGALVLAFLTRHFDVIATAIPLLAFQPILIISQQLGGRKA